MLFAYADPPYMGQAEKHYADDPSCAEVDHVKLLRELQTYYDGWALSCSSVSLWDIARLRDGDGFLVPDDARIGAWVKPFCSFKPKVNPAYAGEPVIFCGGRPRGRELPTVRDWLSASPPIFVLAHSSPVHGEKPDEFSFWLFEILGMKPGDQLVDIYPGSGAVDRAWAKWQTQLWFSTSPLEVQQGALV